MKKLLSLVLILCILSTGFISVSASPSVDDIVNNQTQMEKLLSMLEIMKGFPDGNFYPDYNVTRAEFAKIAVAASSFRNSVASTSLTSPFQDVPYTHWGASYIKVASSNKLVKGYPDSTFKPEDNVLLEEAVTVSLKLLGYTDADFGLSWPDGQMSLATSLDLLEGINKTVGSPLQRGDVMTLVYNTLNTNLKNSQTKAIEGFGYKIVEDVTLIATTLEDPSVSKGKIVTSASTYKIDDSFNNSFVGLKGDIVLKNGDELVAFFPVSGTSTSYGIYSTLNNDIIAYVNGTTQLLDLDENTTAYYKSQKGTLKSFIASIMQGYTVTVYKNYMGTTEYIVISDQKMDGPIVVENADWFASTGLEQSNLNVLRDGKPSALYEIKTYDVVYYSKSLNTVWAYSKKVTGNYDKALPSKELVTTAQISGVNYDLETIDAFNQLGPAGKYNINDSVTLLLGRDGKVVKVLDEGAVKTDKYIVYSKLASDVIVYSGGKLSQLDMDLNTTAYFNGNKSTLRSVLQSVEVGHILSVVYNTDNTVDYVTVNSKKIEGPYTVISSTFESTYSIGSNASYIRDGQSVAKSDIKTNDIIYYSKEMNVVWAYSKKVTGIYEAASPNKDTLTSITVSGTTYPVESVNAFNKLSSTGTFNLGDTVTLLLGKDGGVADVTSPGSGDYLTYGYLIETGTKDFENANGDTYSSYYAKVVSAGGDIYEYKTNSNYKNNLSSIVYVKLNNSIANISYVQTKGDISGTFDASANLIGSTKLADDVKIIDIMNTSVDKAPNYTVIFKQRLDGVEFNNSSILYSTKNDKGEIDQLFLNNLTGDGYKYGIVTSVDKGAGDSLRGTYTCDIAGSEQTLSTSGTTYSVVSGDVAQFAMSGTKISSIFKINKLGAAVTKIDEGYVYTSSLKLPLSDKIVVYERVSAGNWKTVPLSEIIGKDLNFTVYYDDLPQYGGRVRVIIVV